MRWKKSMLNVVTSLGQSWNSKAELTQFRRIAAAKRNKENTDDRVLRWTLSAEVKALDAELADIDAKLTELPLLSQTSQLTVFLSGWWMTMLIRRWGSPREFDLLKAHAGILVRPWYPW